MSLVDSAVVGHYSAAGLAGLGIAATLLASIVFFGVGIILGLDSLIPQALGRGNALEARALYRAGIRLALQIAAPLTIVGALSPELFSIVGIDTEVAREARRYLYGRLPSILPYLLFVASSSYLQAKGHARAIVYAVLIGNLINLAANLVFVFGVPTLGIPALGVLGAAIATSVVSVAMAVFLGVVVYRDKCPGAQAATHENIRKIRKIGLPVGLQLLAEIGVFAIIGMLAGRLGGIASASHQVALILASLTFSVAMGMGAATSVRVGTAIGAGSHVRARRAGIVGVFWSATIMVLAGILFLVIPGQLAGIFSDDSEVISKTVPLLAIAAIFQLADATQAALSGALRGAGDTRATLIGNLVGHYGLGLWVALGLSFGLSMGVVGLWWGLSAGLTLTAIGLAARFWWLTSKPIAQR